MWGVWRGFFSEEVDGWSRAFVEARRINWVGKGVHTVYVLQICRKWVLLEDCNKLGISSY